jgi:hypothetical protein
MEQLQELLRLEGRNIDIEGSIVPQMREIAMHAFSAALPTMASGSVNYCFELMGLDFMIGDDGQVLVLLIGDHCKCLGDG